MTSGSRPGPAVLVALLLVLWPPGSSRAETDLRVGGTIKFYTGLYTEGGEGAGLVPHDSGEFTLTRTELHLKLTGYASDNLSFRSRVDFIYTANPEYTTFSEIESNGGFSSDVHDIDTNLREASFKVIDLFVEGMDLIVGRQRVRWGTSDDYNVIDNLNPVDYANLYSFDPDYFVDHVPMDGLTLEYLFPVDFDLKIQAVYFISFKPSPLPQGFEGFLQLHQQQGLDALTSMLGLPTGVAHVELGDVPEYRIDTGVYGIRLSGNFFNFDVGLSYFRGFQTLPLLERLDTDLTAEIPTMEGVYGYPRLNVLGFDLAGELFSVGLWAEVGVYFPEDRKTVITVRLPTGSTERRFRLLESTYTKFTLGFDYTFGIGEGLYWNTQYNHGFYDEFSYTDEADELLGVDRPEFLGKLEDYYVTYFEYNFLNDTVRCRMTLMLEVGDYGDFSGSTSLLFTPEVEYKPYDGLSLQGGYVAMNGATNSKFGAFSDGDVFYLLLKAMF